MRNKENYISRGEEYVCLSLSSIPECHTCDGFGINSDKKVDAERCYMTRAIIENLLDVKNYPQEH